MNKLRKHIDQTVSTKEIIRFAFLMFSLGLFMHFSVFEREGKEEETETEIELQILVNVREHRDQIIAEVERRKELMEFPLVTDAPSSDVFGSKPIRNVELYKIHCQWAYKEPEQRA